MADIFISYARGDEAQATLFARALQDHGWSVWWDRTIPTGRSYDRVIQEAIDAARCVVVLWSTASVASEWVREEADEGKRRGILIPIVIERGVQIPLGFRRIQAADLAGWRGATGDDAYRGLVRDIAATLATDQPPAVRPQNSPSPDESQRVSEAVQRDSPVVRASGDVNVSVTEDPLKTDLSPTRTLNTKRAMGPHAATIAKVAGAVVSLAILVFAWSFSRPQLPPASNPRQPSIEDSTKTDAAALAAFTVWLKAASYSESNTEYCRKLERAGLRVVCDVLERPLIVSARPGTPAPDIVMACQLLPDETPEILSKLLELRWAKVWDLRGRRTDGQSTTSDYCKEYSTITVRVP